MASQLTISDHTPSPAKLIHHVIFIKTIVQKSAQAESRAWERQKLEFL